MLAAAHFDQFCQALCINSSAFGRMSNSDALLESILRPGASGLQDSLSAIDALDEEDRLAGVLLLSSAWHEKRHFSDLTLTCFGAYRTRLNFQVMFAGPSLLREAKQFGGLVVPITAYADEVRLQALGVEAPFPPELTRMASHLAARYSFHELDRLRLEPGLDIGATSCLEGLAYISQLCAIEFYFGAEASRQVQLRLQSGGLPKIYTWVQRFGRELGLVQDMGPDWPDGAVDVRLTAPLLFMALCGRAPNFRGEGGSAAGTLAAERLPRLLQVMIERKVNFQGMDGQEAWETLDRMHEAVWGCRCIDELEADLARDAEFLSVITDRQGKGGSIGVAFGEYFALRQRMISEFRKTPHIFVDPYVFPMQLLPRLHPRPRLDDPHGRFYPLPEGLQAVCDGVLPQELMDGQQTEFTPWSHWWWSATPQDWPIDGADWGLQSSAWTQVMQVWAPVAKFFISGRAASDCMGPELQIAERLVTDNCPLLLEARAARGAVPDPATFWFTHGDELATCDLSGEAIAQKDAMCISPWRIRLSERNIDFVLDGYGRDNPLAWPMLLKDWGIWVVHKRFDAQLEP